jgi:hypothetical protein
LRNQGLLQTLEKFKVLQTWIFLRFETDLYFSRPGFSEIKVDIKRPIGSNKFYVGWKFPRLTVGKIFFRKKIEHTSNQIVLKVFFLKRNCS